MRWDDLGGSGKLRADVLCSGQRDACFCRHEASCCENCRSDNTFRVTMVLLSLPVLGYPAHVSVGILGGRWHRSLCQACCTWQTECSRHSVCRRVGFVVVWHFFICSGVVFSSKTGHEAGQLHVDLCWPDGAAGWLVFVFVATPGIWPSCCPACLRICGASRARATSDCSVHRKQSGSLCFPG